MPSANSLAPGALLGAVSCPAVSFCEAVGQRTAARGATVPLAEVWNGRKWSRQQTPQPPGATLEAVSCASPDACLATGSSAPVGGAQAAFAEVWNGHTWSVTQSPGPLDRCRLAG